MAMERFSFDWGVGRRFSAGHFSTGFRILVGSARRPLCSLVWLVWIEGFRPAGSWQLFNYIGTGVSAWIKPLPMLSLALMIATIVGSALKLRGRPTWIALPSGILAVLAWYLACAHPYDDPMIVERSPAVRILHLEKQGLRIRETTVTIGGHGEAWIRKSERRLFQYRWELRWSRISPVGAAPAIEIVSKLKALREPPPVPSEWTADEWYLASDNRLYLLPEAPPAVHRIIDKAGVLEQKGEARDICLGFCYEPLVTLGYGSRQDRARFFATVP
jgi:hypothetical protein